MPHQLPEQQQKRKIEDIDFAYHDISSSFIRAFLYIKTKSFHWYVSGPHFRDYHLLLDD
jgi:DNA-binding ferritin-like protein